MTVIMQKDGTAESFCDTCGEFYAVLDKEYLQYSGYLNNTPKFDIKCARCWDLQYRILTGDFVIPVTLRKDDVIMADANVKVERKVLTAEEVSAKFNWATIEEAIKAGTFKTQAFATENGLNPTIVKDQLVAKYGDRLEFRRGRNGGVFFVDAAK